MGGHRLPGLTVLVAAAGAALVAGAGPAAAETTPAPLYVNLYNPAGCSDTGSGTEAVPFCTIASALAVAVAGQTINIVPGGTYAEHLTFPRSGESGRPITLRSAGTNPVRLTGGPDVGVTIDGRHDLVVDGVSVEGAATAPGFDVRNSSHVTVQHSSVLMAAAATATSIRLAGVTDSSLLDVQASGAKNTVGIALDAATSGVLVKNSEANATSDPGGRAIEVLGSRNMILDNLVGGGGSASIALAGGAADNVVANNSFSRTQGFGIDNSDASGTAITNNDLHDSCKTGIRVAGVSSGVSVQNNVVRNSGSWSSWAGSCTGVEIGVYDGAVGHTVVDYNSVFHGSPGASGLYAWNGTGLGLTAFRTASGQGAHDADGPWTDTVEDSANSAAPGWQSTDYTGSKREDNPDTPNTGAGPVPYADRGVLESVRGPLATLQLRPDYAANSISADASGSTPGFSPIVGYSFNWGDATTTSQATPVGTHHYAKPGTYTVVVTVTDANGHQWLAQQSASLWPTVRTIALLAHDSNRYVTAGPGGYNWLSSSVYSWSIGAPELFDVVEPGNGHIALRSRINGTYFSVNAGGPLIGAGDPITDDLALFDLTTNADGIVSLWSVGRKAYVSSNSGGDQVLTADRAAIGPWEQFGVVKQADAGVTLKAHANGQYVTAENGGNSSLIANRAAPGQWETFDLVDAGGGYVALYSHANGKYVTAENGGSSPLIANRTAVGLWEKFKVIKNADGSISLQANANGKYVTAENGGNSALIANRTAIGLWEAFN